MGLFKPPYYFKKIDKDQILLSNIIRDFMIIKKTDFEKYNNNINLLDDATLINLKEKKLFI